MRNASDTGSCRKEFISSKNLLGSLPARRLTLAVIASLAFLIALASEPVFAVEHPGTIAKDVECSSCHADKISGKSVHSAMATSCTVCHVSRTQGDMTTMNLAMPRERICFACHEKAEATKLHRAGAKGLCMDCHDAHSSDQRMLLRVAGLVPAAGLKGK